jgi:hypothetical protein
VKKVLVKGFISSMRLVIVRFGRWRRLLCEKDITKGRDEFTCRLAAGAVAPGTRTRYRPNEGALHEQSELTDRPASDPTIVSFSAQDFTGKQRTLEADKEIMRKFNLVGQNSSQTTTSRFRQSGFLGRNGLLGRWQQQTQQEKTT